MKFISRILEKHGTLVRFSTSSVLLQAINMLCSLLVLKWLPPREMGLWQSLLLLGTYAGIAQGGAIHGLSREMPFAMGQAKDTEVAELVGTAQISAAVGAGLCLLGIPLGWLFFSTQAERWGTSAVLFATAVGIYRNYLRATYRASRTFDSLAKIQGIEALLALGTLPLVWGLGFAGLAVRHLIIEALSCLLNHLLRPMKSLASFRWRSLERLIATGLPIFAFAYLSDVARSLPRLALLKLGGVLWVGVFAPASAMVGVIQMVPSAMSAYIYPQMTYRLGKSGDPATLWPVARAAALIPLAVTAPFALLLIVIFPPLIARFFPTYVECIPALRWTAGAGVFCGAGIAVNALASLKAYRAMAWFVANRLIVLAVFPFAAGWWCQTLTGVAAGMAIAYAVDFCVVLWLVRSATLGKVT